MEDAKNARYMLANPTVVAGKMGRVLAHCLLEFLPFETETEEMTASVWLILQPGLIGAADRLSLGKKSARKQAYLVDLLQALPDDLYRNPCLPGAMLRSMRGIVRLWYRSAISALPCCCDAVPAWPDLS